MSADVVDGTICQLSLPDRGNAQQSRRRDAARRMHVGLRAMNHDRSTIEKIAALLGESFREVAVLLAVFVPLDVYVQGRTLTVRTALATIALVVVVLAIGVFLEVKRWKR